MDKFVIRSSTWKTMSYQPFAAATKGRSSLAGNNSTPKLLNSNRKPMKEKKIENILNETKSNRRLSLLDEKLIQIFSTPADEPLLPSGDSVNGEFLSCGTPRTPKNQIDVNDENALPSNKKYTPQIYRTPSSKASDYLSNTDVHRISVSEASKDGSVPFERLLYDEQHVSSPFKLQRFNNNTNTPVMDRIQNDLNSPSASVRLRAMKALKDSQSYAAYTKLDVPHAEQSIITAEERKPPPPPRTIQDVMKDVVAYVELRSGEDNRSAGIKKYLETLGARVNDKLLRNTTHVIFNEGLLSTYKKAKNWNIPIVSILWVNACEEQIRLCDPKDFPISNADRYENPELYDKMKRVKCIHPDSELNKRVRIKPSTPKEATPKRGVATPKTKKLTSPITKPTSGKGKGKTEISDYFKPIVKKLDEHGKVIMPSTPVAATPPAKPANKVNSNGAIQTPLRTLTKQINKINLKENDNGNENGNGQESAKANGVKDLSKDEVPAIKTDTPHSRIDAGHDSNIPDSSIKLKTPSPPSIRYRTRRRSSLYASENMSNSTGMVTPKSTRKQKLAEEISTIMEEEAQPSTKPNKTNSTSEDISIAKSPNNKKGRRTSYTHRTLDISKSPPKSNANDHITSKIPVSLKTQSRRRTLFTPQKMDLTGVVEQNEDPAQPTETTMKASSTTLVSGNDIRWTNVGASSTLINAPSFNTPEQCRTLFEEQDETVVFSSIRDPKNRKTLFDVGMNIITQRMQNINRSARRSIATMSAEDVVQRPQNSQIDLHKSKTTPNLQSETTRDSASGVGIKKRKLFMPNESLSQELAPTISGSTSSATKRRRTLMPPVQQSKPEEGTFNKDDNSQLSSAKNIGSSDISEKSKEKKNISSDGDCNESSKEVSSNQKPASSAATTTRRAGRRSTMLFEKNERSVKAQQSAQKALAKDTRKVLVYTNMHMDQINVIRETLTYLGGFRLDYAVNNTTTHLVSLEPRRTLNMLRALIRGLWILDFKWVRESHKAGKWLPEEQFEMKNFSRAVEICRTERQAFKEYYQCDLFRDLDTFYVSSECAPLSKQNLKELIKSCGGHVSEHRRSAKYIVANKHKGGGSPDSLYVTPFWILDSITQMQLLPYQKYTLPRAIPRKAYSSESPYKSHADVMKALQLTHFY